MKIDILKPFLDKYGEEKDADNQKFNEFLSIFPAQAVDFIANQLYSGQLRQNELSIFEQYQHFIDDPNNFFHRKKLQKKYIYLNQTFDDLIKFTSNEFLPNSYNSNVFQLVRDDVHESNIYDQKRIVLQKLVDEFQRAYIEFVRYAGEKYVAPIFYVVAIVIGIVAIVGTGVFTGLRVPTQESSIPRGESAPSSIVSEPIYPKQFFDFSYEQDGFQKIRDEAIAKLNSGNPIRYCGTYFFDVYDVFESNEKYVETHGEVFDCKEFGTGGSLIKTVKNVTQERSTPDEFSGPDTFHIRTDALYSIGDIQITETDIGDNWFAVPTSCDISITKNGKLIFQMTSDEYQCTPLGSVEHNGNVLLLVQEPTGTGNSYTSTNHFLFITKGDLYDLGSFVAAAGNNGWTVKDFWTDGTSFYFWQGDGRYEYKFGSHNASTYSFIPRVFSATPQNNSVLLTEGTSVSKEVANIYKYQLNAIGVAFEKFGADGNFDKDTINAFVPYWVGMARYSLTNTSLISELGRVQSELTRLNLGFPDGLELVYGDIKSGKRSVSPQ